MTQYTSDDRALIDYVKIVGGKTEAEAIEYLNQHCGDWQGTPVPTARPVHQNDSD